MSTSIGASSAEFSVVELVASGEAQPVFQVTRLTKAKHKVAERKKDREANM